MVDVHGFASGVVDVHGFVSGEVDVCGAGSVWQSCLHELFVIARMCPAPFAATIAFLKALRTAKLNSKSRTITVGADIPDTRGLNKIFVRDSYTSLFSLWSPRSGQRVVSLRGVRLWHDTSPI